MGTPSDINRAHISFDSASKVLVALDAGNGVETEASERDTNRGANPPPPNVDGYILDRPLGSGATGITYLAHKHNAEARVALKVLHASLGNTTKSSRAWRELDALQQIRVPSVPRLLDYGTTGGSLYIATEFLEGSPLDRLYEHARPASPAEMRSRVQLLERLARAAHTLHEHGVIHRDLKPSNVIVMPSRGGNRTNDCGHKDVGEPFIIDLGIALIDTTDLQQTLTIEGTPIGTPAFMAPEQARGIRSEISTRSDIYALGAIGYWLATGQTPHDLTGVTLHEAIRRVGSDPPREPRSISAKLPKPLAAVLAKACAPKPADRYGSATALADDLARWLAREPVHATNPGPWRRLTRLIGKHPAWTTAAGCVVLLASTAGLSYGVVKWLNNKPHRVVYDIESHSWVGVTSRSGNYLKKWPAFSPSGPIFAEDVAAPPSLGHGRLAVFGMQYREDDSAVSRLRVFSFTDLDTQLWSTPIKPPDIHMPPGTEGWVEDNPSQRFVFANAVIGDIDPALPGDEIAVVLNHELKSPACVRVYSLQGKLLFEAWHNGRINGVAWLKDPGLLVCTGPTDSPWLSELGLEDADREYPIMVYALRIPAAPPSSQPITPVLLDSWNAQPSGVIVWSRTVWPPSVIRVLDKPGILAKGPETVACEISSDSKERLRRPAITFTLDSAGNTVERSPSDGLKSQHPSISDTIELRDPTTIKTRPTPPIRED